MQGDKGAALLLFRPARFAVQIACVAVTATLQAIPALAAFPGALHVSSLVRWPAPIFDAVSLQPLECHPVSVQALCRVEQTSPPGRAVVLEMVCLPT